MMLTLSNSNIGMWTVIHVAGEVDMATGPQLRQEIVRQVSEGNIHLVVDLRNVDFIDSTGLGILVGGVKRARSNGGDFRCSGLSSSLEEVFALTGLDSVLAVVDLDQDPSSWTKLNE